MLRLFASLSKRRKKKNKKGLKRSLALIIKPTKTRS